MIHRSNTRATTQRRLRGAFTRIELLVGALMLALLIGVLIPTIIQKKHSSQLAACSRNLKQMILAELLWVNDSNVNNFPANVSTNKGGSSEYLIRGEFFQHFRNLSNELVSPTVLVCPSDNRKAARGFSSLGNSNLSYFINMDSGALGWSGPPRYPPSEELLQRIALGDRNVTNNSGRQVGIINITASNHSQLGWSSRMHNSGRNAYQPSIGNVAFLNGAVENVTATNLQRAFKYEVGEIWWGAFITNRLALP